jgi:hypothetical protein
VCDAAKVGEYWPETAIIRISCMENMQIKSLIDSAQQSGVEKFAYFSGEFLHFI